MLILVKVAGMSLPILGGFIVIVAVVLLVVCGLKKWRNREHGEDLDLKDIRANPLSVKRQQSASSQKPLLDKTLSI